MKGISGLFFSIPILEPFVRYKHLLEKLKELFSVTKVEFWKILIFLHKYNLLRHIKKVKAHKHSAR